MSSSIPMVPGGKILARLVAIVVILTARQAVGAPAAPASPAALSVFHCDFDSAWDANYDGWPDGWTRAAGPGYPKYVGIEVVRPTAGEAACLRIELDGGGAIAYSPLASASAEYSYQLAVEGLAEGLSRDQVWASLIFYDAERRPLETHDSRRLAGTTPWTSLEIGPIAAQHPGARYFAVGLHVEPQGRPDVRGSARFRGVRVLRLPRLEVESQQPTHVYASPTQIELSCRVSGYASRAAALRFALTDCEGRPLDEFTEPLPQVNADWFELATAGRRVTTWRPKLPDFGYYRATVTLEDAGRKLVERSLPLAVVAMDGAHGVSEFGWALTDDAPLPAAELGALVAQGGIGWLKTPLWLDENDPKLSERIALIERTASHGVRAVGVLDRPPPQVVAGLKREGEVTAAEVLSADPLLWYPSLEATLARLGMRVRWWQLGADGDESLLADPKLADKLLDVRRRFDQLGQGAGLGLSWNWLYPLPPEAQRCFFSLWADPGLTHDELRALLDVPPAKGHTRWVLLEALSRHEYSTDERAADLVARMIAAKVGNAEAIFLRNPFDPDRGVLGAQGQPDELFVPWRTAALALAGAAPLGSLELPAGSRNHAFGREGEATLAIWAETPRVETLHLGPEARVFDLWGRPRALAAIDQAQQLEVGPEPCFIRGLAQPAVQWQLGAQLEPRRLPTRLGGTQTLEVRLDNPFPQGATGAVRIVPPERWRISPPSYRFKVPSGQRHVQSLEVSLPYDASSGPQWVRLDFEISAGRPYVFSVFRQVTIGDDDVELLATTRLNEQGELEVEQRLVNHGPVPLSFRCDLFVRGRKRMRRSVLEREQGEDVQVYRLRDGRDLIGQTLLLRAEEIDGARIVNTRIVAEP